MNGDIPLTPEQSLFAAKHHELVYKFLREKHLSPDEFYDVVIFGYLRAVRRYLTVMELKQYAFATIAWKAMEGGLHNYYRSQKSKRNYAEVYSLQSAPYEGGLRLEETIASPNELMQQVEYNLLLHELAGRASRQQMNVVLLKSEGYTNKDIARHQKTSVSFISKILKDMGDLLAELCYE